MKTISVVAAFVLFAHGLKAATNSPSVQFGTNFSTIKVKGASVGALYQIQASADLVSWEEITPAIDVRDENFILPVPLGRESIRFFRYVEFMPSVNILSDETSPEFRFVAGGSVDVTSVIFKFRASGESGFMDRLALRLSSGSSASVVLATVWDGGVKVGETVFIGSRRRALAVLNQPVLLNKDANKSITVKLDLACIGVACTGVSGDVIQVDYDDTQPDPELQTRVIGIQSGRKIAVTGSTHSAGLGLFKSFPTVVLDPLPANGAADGRMLRFKVATDPKGPVSLAKFMLLLVTQNCGVPKAKLFAFTDSAYSQPVSGFGTGGELDSEDVLSAGAALVPLYCKRLDGKKAALTIPAGATYYFEVRGAVIPKEGQYGFVASLLGDSAPPSRPLLSVGVLEDQSKHFIWSPNSLGQSRLTDADWTSGYSITGLPPAGINQFRTN